ncbi:MAG TPA: isoprenylcysteine carboxylmethyltransferase family protein [Gaiellaceae bacterium]
MPASSRLPELGRRGEGWVLLQSLLLVCIVATGFTGVYWPRGVEGVLAVLGLVVALIGLSLLLVAALSLGASLTVLPKPRERGGLVQSGIYRAVRHPVYGAVLLLALGWSLAESPLGLIPTLLLAIVFDLKARLEEAWLQERHPDYALYRKQTPRRFVPGVY